MSASIVLWGTYDIGKPRVRNLISALKRLDPDIASSHFNLWAGVEDKSQIRAKVFISMRCVCIAWGNNGKIHEKTFCCSAREISRWVLSYKGLLRARVDWQFWQGDKQINRRSRKVFWGSQSKFDRAFFHR